MRRSAALVFSAWVLLAGRTGPTYSYSKPGSTEMDFKRESYAGVQDSRVSAGGPTILAAHGDAKREVSLYRVCVEAGGWTAE